MSKKILLPIDFENSSQHIIDEAVKFAKILNAKIVLLHIASLEIGFVIADLGFQYLPELENTELEREANELTIYKNEISSHNIECESFMLQGIPSDTIIEKSKEFGVDYIVMGTHARGAFFEAILGSVTKDVLKKSKIPVLLVPSIKKKV